MKEIWDKESIQLFLRKFNFLWVKFMSRVYYYTIKEQFYLIHL